MTPAMRSDDEDEEEELCPVVDDLVPDMGGAFTESAIISMEKAEEQTGPISALVFDCGTGETKALFFSFTGGWFTKKSALELH